MSYPLGAPTITLLHPGIDPPICERCAESEVTMVLKEIGVCDDCFCEVMREVLEPLLGYAPCCEFWSEIDHSHQPALCLAPCGVEHTHQDGLDIKPLELKMSIARNALITVANVGSGEAKRATLEALRKIDKIDN